MERNGNAMVKKFDLSRALSQNFQYFIYTYSFIAIHKILS